MTITSPQKDIHSMFSGSLLVSPKTNEMRWRKKLPRTTVGLEHESKTQFDHAMSKQTISLTHLYVELGEQ